MKKVFYLISVLIMVFAVSNVSMAAEVAVDKISIQNASAQDVFGITILENGDSRVTPGKVFTEGYDDGSSLPVLLSYPKAMTYPKWAVRQGWQGVVTLALEILPNGQVGRLMVMKSSGRKTLDNSASDAVKTWKFQPAMKEGKPVVSCIQIPVKFELQ